MSSLRAAWAVAVRLPSYLTIALSPHHGGLGRLPARVWTAFRIFRAVDRR